MGFLTNSLNKNSQNDVKLLETWLWFWHILGKGTHIYSNQTHPVFHQKSPWTPMSKISLVCIIGKLSSNIKSQSQLRVLILSQPQVEEETFCYYKRNLLKKLLHFDFPFNARIVLVESADATSFSYVYHPQGKTEQQRKH